MTTVLLQFRFPGSAPSVDDVRRLFNLEADEIDTRSGITASDPAAQLYTVLVAAEASERIQKQLAARPSVTGEGVFSNPRIETFGPPEA